MKKIRSLNVNKKILSLVAVLSVGYLGLNLLDKKLDNFYTERKEVLEDEIGSFLNKDIKLGDYKGIGYLGIGISNSQIIDKENINSKIEAKTTYIGIMPIRSLLNQKWIINIKPKNTSFNINKDFLQREKSLIKRNKSIIEEIKYDLNFHIKDFANFKINDLGIESKIKGNFRYSSEQSEIIGFINSKFKNRDNLKLKFNTKLNQDSFGFQILSEGVNLGNLNINTLNKKLALKGGKLKSNFKFYRSSTGSYCKGRFSLINLELKAINLEENVNSEYIRFFCKNNNLVGKTNNLTYGSLISDLNINIPLSKSINNIFLDGSIRYEANKKSKIILSANMPYWFDKRGINFGNINSSFNLTRTELANLNIFRKNGIQGLITAKGDLTGTLIDPDLKIEFNVDTPNYKGIRFRETWAGEITNKNNDYLINIQSRSPIPSFLTLNFDSNIKLNNLIFSRLFSGNKGTLNILRNNDNYSWEAINLPLDELEFSTNNRQFDRISGTVNGAGILSTDLSNNTGRIGWSFGKFRNLDLKTSYFDFKIKDNKYYVDSFIIPDDGGIIKLLYDSEKDKIVEIDFDNVSTKWSILNAINTFKIDNNKIQTKGKAKVLDFLEISNQDKKLVEQIKLVNDYKENKSILENTIGVEKYFRKFESRYSGKLIIKGDNISNYKIASKINGFIDLKSDNKQQNNKEYFSLDLNGGLFQGKGNLVINEIPLKSINIFLEDPKDFKGGFDLELNYDLEKKYFKTELFANNALIKDYKLNLKKGKIEYNKNGKNRFDLDLSLLFHETNKPIKLYGFLPLNKKGILDLELKGKSEFLKLIDVFYGENINFKKGDISLAMRIRGPMSQPIFRADLDINDSEINIFKNNLKNINSNIQIFGDQVKINNFSAFGEKKGGIIIRGNLPIYREKISKEKSIKFTLDEFNLVSENNDLILESDIDISGSFLSPTLAGNLSLSNGYFNIKNSNKNNYKNENNNNKIINKNNLQDRFWIQNKAVEIISNEEVRLSELITKNIKQEYLFNLNFDDFKVIIGPNFRLGLDTATAYLETAPSLLFNESLRDQDGDKEIDLKIRGLIDIKKGRAKYGATPFKFEKNNNSILFAKRLGINPLVNFNLFAKVPEPIVPISQNNQDGNISEDLKNNNDSSGFGTIGIGNSRTIKIDASYSGLITKISTNEEFENYWFKRLQFRSSPRRSKSEIIALIGGNSANLINRAFISQLDGANAFSERFQLSLYPALIENKEQTNNVFSNENTELNNTGGSTSNSGSSSQAWVAEIGLDITDQINFAVQATPDRDDLPPLGIFTLQANPNIELQGSFDSDGDWKSQVQLFLRY